MWDWRQFLIYVQQLALTFFSQAQASLSSSMLYSSASLAYQSSENDIKTTFILSTAPGLTKSMLVKSNNPRRNLRKDGSNKSVVARAVNLLLLSQMYPIHRLIVLILYGRWGIPCQEGPRFQGMGAKATQRSERSRASPITRTTAFSTRAKTSPLKRRESSTVPHPQMKFAVLLQLPTTSFAKHVLDVGKQTFPPSQVKSVEVKRPVDVEESRILLPIITEEQL